MQGITVIDIEGCIDINSSEIVETVGLLLRNDKLKILCNLENVELVDYSGLSILAISYRNVANHKGMMKFCNAGLHIKELFRVVQMDTVFYCYDSEEEALRDFDDKTVEIEQRPLRRRFKRLEINMNVDYSLVAALDKRGRLYRGKVFNVSGSGMYVYSPYIFPVRTQLKLTIALPREIAPLEIEGMVIWVSDRHLQPSSHPGMGIQFTHLDSQEQKELLDFIERNITHRSEI